MRLIDADELIKVFRAYALMRSGQYRESFTNADGNRSMEIACAENVISRQKTIDAEPVKHALDGPLSMKVLWSFPKGKHGIVVPGGVVDSGYTGSIKVKLENHTAAPYKFERGDKIAQIIFIPCLLDELNWI